MLIPETTKLTEITIKSSKNKTEITINNTIEKNINNQRCKENEMFFKSYEVKIKLKSVK